MGRSLQSSPIEEEHGKSRRAEADGTLLRFGRLYGASMAMRALYEKIGRVAPTEATVLVVGESGCGKELVARTLHDLSARAAGAFVAVNCGAIPRHLLEAELFGHEKGSFTGAHQQHAGHFERANGGTLFLDEVTEMPLDMQVKVLRVLETRQVHRVGASHAIDVDLRVIAATNREPQAEVASGAFRQDLLYRLAVFPLRVPPLRDRDADIVALARHFLAALNHRVGASKFFSKSALAAIERQRWPGNVRELRNAVQRAFILADDAIDFPQLGPARPPPTMRRGRLQVAIGTPLADAQREMILATLAHCGGDKPRTADMLGVSLKTLYNRLHVYRLNDPAAAAAAAR